ncbi:MAG TPA: dihydrofolate reductase family protein [Rhodopseudomonas sp.]|uniref:RibD family protein n=1 Tax=Rhodopseudomonas sp. TaxID=1078 RepID=UPI002ED85D46
MTVYSEVSADGKSVHRRNGSSKDMMVFEDDAVKKYRHELRARSDAIMVGSNTIRLDDPHLTVRNALGTSPLRVIPVSTGDIPPTSNILRDGGRTLIAVGASAPLARIHALRQAGAAVLTMETEQIDLTMLLSHLYSLNIRSLMVEGGATLLAALFRARLVDRLIVQHLPVIFGGRDTPSMVGGAAIAGIDEAIEIRLSEVLRIGGHAIISYQCK